MASTPCEGIKSWSCLLDPEEKRPLTGAQGLHGGSRAGLREDEPLESPEGYFSLNNGSRGLV